MIEALVVRENGLIISYEISGHAGYGKKGSDIICAAVSTVAQQTAIGIINYLEINVKPNIKDGFLSLDLKNVDNKGKNNEINALLESMYMTLIQIEEQYPKYVKLIVKEGKKNV